MASIEHVTLEAIEAKCFSFGPLIEGYNVELTVMVDGKIRYVHGQACSELPESHEFYVTDNSLMELLVNEDSDDSVDDFACAAYDAAETFCFEELDAISGCESEYTPMFLIASRILMEMQEDYGACASED